MGKWRGPIGVNVILSYSLALGIVALIVLPVLLATGFIKDAGAFLVSTFGGILGSAIVLRLTFSEVWDFINKKYNEPSHRMMTRLEGALAARGVPFAVRNRAKRSLFRLKIDGFLDLDRGVVTIALAPEGETTRVFLGPVERDNEVVIERLKALVDGAVG